MDVETGVATVYEAQKSAFARAAKAVYMLVSAGAKFSIEVRSSAVPLPRSIL